MLLLGDDLSSCLYAEITLLQSTLIPSLPLVFQFDTHLSLSLINIAANYHYEIFLTSMMDDMCGFPSSDSNTSEGYTYYTTPLKEADYEAFQSSWSSGVSLSAASEDAAGAANYTISSIPRSGSSTLEGESSNAIKAKICSHPLYPKLLEAYFDCQKVGAPLETVNLLNEILHGNDLCRNNTLQYCLGEDPELDEFMETYCNVLSKYKLDLARPYEEATKFLSNMETQLSDLCNNTSKDLDEQAKSSNQDKSNGEMEVQQKKEHNGTSEANEIKEKLLSKYSGYISSLRDEFYKKKKKGKLPKDARQILLNWWNIHYTWPYPTEADKIALASTTGLDQKQINNWFINQRKRHWKPPEGMQYPSAMSSNEYGSFFLDVD